MKHHIILIFAFISLNQNYCIGFPSKDHLVQDHPALKISRLTGDFYIYTTYKDLNGFLFPSNSMYLDTEAGIVLIDTPWDTSQFQPLLDSINNRHNKKVILCIVTHFHDDRTAGLEYFRMKGIPTYSSFHTRKLCIDRNEKTAEHVFVSDTIFRAGVYSIVTYYPGAGHSPDNIVIWFPANRILYGGCFIKSTENRSLGNIDDADVSEWKKSIKNIKRKFKNPEYIIPGHFSWESKNSLQHTLKLLNKHRT